MESLETDKDTILEKDNKLFASKEQIEDWKDYYLKEGHSYKSMINYYNYIKLFVGEGIVLKQKNIDLFRDKHYNTVSSSALKSFFYYLTIKKKYPRDVLNFYYGKNKSTKKEPTPLEPLEVMKLIESLKKDSTISTTVKLMTIFTYELALRVSESLKVKWTDFNWMTWISNKQEYGYVNITKSKRGKFRTIPVNPEIMKLLYETHKNKSSLDVPIGGLVFDFGINEFEKDNRDENLRRYRYLIFAYNQYRYVLTKTAKEVLNKDIHIHQLRHGKAQSLLNMGISLDSLKSLLGHESISTTEIYAKSSPIKLLNELKKIDEKKDNIC